MKFRLAVLAALVVVVMFPVVVSAAVTIPDGTEIRLILQERLTSATAEVDQKVRLEVAEDVFVNNVVVIKAGAQAWGHVVEARKRGRFGKNGKLNFTIDFVKSTDGQNIRLREIKKREGNNDYVKAGVVTYLTGIGGVFVKGKDVEIEAGTEWTIYIDGDRRLSSAR